MGGFSTCNLLTKYFKDGTISESDHERFIIVVLPSIIRAYDIYLKNVLRRLFISETCAVILNARMHAGQMLNILLNDTVNSLQFDNYEIERLYKPFVKCKCLCDDELPTDTLIDAILNGHDDGSIEY